MYKTTALNRHICIQ